MGVTLFNDQRVGQEGPELDDNPAPRVVEYDGQAYCLGPNQTLNIADDGNALTAADVVREDWYADDTVVEKSGAYGGQVEGVQRS